MKLDLREIIGVPGGRVAFDYEPDLSDAVDGSIVLVRKPSRAAGSVVNKAGVLTLTANVDAILVCVCARCLKEFEYPVHKQVETYLTEEGEGGSADSYFLQGDMADVGSIILTEFILGTDDRMLCSGDCAGLCTGCGADLNTEQCSCGVEIDSRLAVLRQLLDVEGGVSNGSTKE